MFIIHQSALYIHIALGACALLLFWVPVFTRKGNFNHKRFGRFFAWAMYTVSFSGITMSSLDLLFPIAMHAPGLDLSQQQSVEITREVRQFGLFLLSLSFLVLTSTRHGWLTILHRDDRQALRHPLHVGLNLMLSCIGLLLLVTGVRSGTILFSIFGGFQVVTGISNLRYVFRAEVRPREWWVQHLSGLIGSGIGAYTAFTVFGGRRFFEQIFSSNFESLAIFLWIGPGVIGGIAIALLSSHYRKKFTGDWAIKRARLRSQLSS